MFVVYIEYAQSAEELVDCLSSGKKPDVRLVGEEVREMILVLARY
jgi:hypothetical protein